MADAAGPSHRLPTSAGLPRYLRHAGDHHARHGQQHAGEQGEAGQHRSEQAQPAWRCGAAVTELRRFELLDHPRRNHRQILVENQHHVIGQREYLFRQVKPSRDFVIGDAVAGRDVAAFLFGAGRL